ILASTDGGAAWHALHVPGEARLHAVAGSRADELYAVGDRGAILRAEGDAATWQPRDSGTADDLTGVAVTRAGVVVAVAGSTIARSTDRGQSFVAGRPPAGAAPVAVGAEGRDVVAVGAMGEILRSSDEGASFGALAPTTPSTLAGVAVTPSATIAVGTF